MSVTPKQIHRMGSHRCTNVDIAGHTTTSETKERQSPTDTQTRRHTVETWNTYAITTPTSEKRVRPVCDVCHTATDPEAPSDIKHMHHMHHNNIQEGSRSSLWRSSHWNRSTTTIQSHHYSTTNHMDQNNIIGGDTTTSQWRLSHWNRSITAIQLS